MAYFDYKKYNESQLAFSKDWSSCSASIPEHNLKVGDFMIYVGKAYVVTDVKGSDLTLLRGSCLSDVQINKSKTEIADTTPTQTDYDFINPSHYKRGGKEVWEMMIDIWGVDAFIKHCEMCAYKYMQRLGKKPNATYKQDLSKALWYLKKAEELQNVSK